VNTSTNDWKIPLYRIFTDEEDIKIVEKVIRRGTDWALGPEISEFENNIKNYVGTDFCVAFNSGTSALHATYLAYDLGHGDEIIIPSFSFVATANSTMFVNAIPKFADIEETNFGLDPTLLSNSITSKTKAIVPMDYGGLSCKISEIKKIARDNNLILIEDAAESLGSSSYGQKVGSVSDSSIFSFCGNKVLTTGEGGAVVTNSKEIYEKLKLIRSHGRLDDTNYFNSSKSSTYLGVGYNWRMSSLVAALGISQISKLDKIIKLRQQNAQIISNKLSSIPEIITPKTSTNYENIFQMYTIQLSDEKLRNDLQKFLESKKILSKIYFEPIHQMDFYKNSLDKNDTLPITEKISKTVLTLPIFPNMTKEEINYLSESIHEFFENNYRQ